MLAAQPVEQPEQAVDTAGAPSAEVPSAVEALPEVSGLPELAGDHLVAA